MLAFPVNMTCGMALQGALLRQAGGHADTESRSFPKLVAISIAPPPEVLRQRLASRDRGSVGEIAGRLERSDLKIPAGIETIELDPIEQRAAGRRIDFIQADWRQEPAGHRAQGSGGTARNPVSLSEW